MNQLETCRRKVGAHAACLPDALKPERTRSLGRFAIRIIVDRSRN